MLNARHRYTPSPPNVAVSSVQTWHRQRLANRAAMLGVLAALLSTMGVVALAAAFTYASSAPVLAVAAIPLAAAAGAMLRVRSIRGELLLTTQPDEADGDASLASRTSHHELLQLGEP